MADGVTLRWHGAVITAKIERELNRRLKASAILVANRAKELVSTAYPPASEAGNPPAKRSGHLRRSIATEPGDARLTYRVGTGLIYGRALELGYSGNNLAPRPWLRPAYMQCQPRIQAIMNAPIV